MNLSHVMFPLSRNDMKNEPFIARSSSIARNSPGFISIHPSLQRYLQLSFIFHICLLFIFPISSHVTHKIPKTLGVRNLWSQEGNVTSSLFNSPDWGWIGDNTKCDCLREQRRELYRKDRLYQRKRKLSRRSFERDCIGDKQWFLPLMPIHLRLSLLFQSIRLWPVQPKEWWTSTNKLL
jgi:hypothetical protein